MQIHHLIRPTTVRKSRRVGRGGKRGTYSGRGIKGLGARAGGKFRPEERDIIKRIPKLRGYRFRSHRPKPAAVNVARVRARYSDGETVSPETLLRKRMIRRSRGRAPRVKIIGAPDLTRKFVFKDVLFSRATAKIARA